MKRGKDKKKERAGEGKREVVRLEKGHREGRRESE